MAGPAIVRKRGRAAAAGSCGAAGDRHHDPPQAAKPLRTEQAPEPDDDPEATARVKAFFAPMIRPPK